MLQTQFKVGLLATNLPCPQVSAVDERDAVPSSCSLGFTELWQNLCLSISSKHGNIGSIFSFSEDDPFSMRRKEWVKLLSQGNLPRFIPDPINHRTDSAKEAIGNGNVLAWRSTLHRRCMCFCHVISRESYNERRRFAYMAFWAPYV